MGKATGRVFAAISILLLAILACQPGPAPAPVVPSPAISIEEALTFTVQTFTAQAPTVSLPTPVAFVETLPPAFTLEAPSLTVVPPADTLVPSPAVPMASVSVATFCRTGPGQIYDRAGVVDVGMTVQVIGKYTPNHYWIVLMPDGSQCWLWGEFASIVGDVSNLPEFDLPPTPLPPLGSITGIVKASTGSPIVNATVTAQLAGRTSTTGGDGRYTFDNLRTGTEFITVEGTAYNSRFQSVIVSKDGPVTADFVLTKGTLFLFPATVQGVVLSNSSPVAGVTVRIWSRKTSAVTDSNGHYSINISSGKFLLLVESGDLRGGVEVVLPANQTTTAPDIILSSR